MISTPILLLVLSATPSGDELIPNGAMEGPFAGGIARGWHNNGWGKNTVTLSPGEPRSGKASQKMACSSYANGAVQLFHPLPVAAGKRYKLSLWMRAEGGVGSVGVGLRHVPSPYTMHAGASFEPGDEWEPFTFEGTSARSDDRAGLFLWFAPDGPGTLWVDDVSVVAVDPQAVRLPLPPGNVVPNASFELALQRDWRSRTASPRYDTQKPFHGARSLRWDFAGAGADTLAARAVEFGGHDRVFTLAVAVRARGQATLSAALWPAVRVGAKGPVLRLECRPQGEWKVFRTSGPIPADAGAAYCLEIDVRAPQAATVWLDAVRLEPGDAAGPPRCRRSLEATLACDALAHVHRPGQPVRLEVRAFDDGVPGPGEGPEKGGKSNLPRSGPATLRAVPGASHKLDLSPFSPRAARLACRVTDYRRRPVAEIPVALELKPGSGASATIELPLRDRTGVYLAELCDGDEVLSGLSLSVLPEPSRVPAERSALGGHFRLDEFHLKVAAAMGVRWTRIHDCESITHWRTAEPEQGRFEWFDEKVGLARRHGVRVLGEFLRVPAWASSAPKEVTGGEVHLHPPRDLDELAAYVRAVVGHYKGDIRHWEIWNEPYGSGFWRGTPEQYAELARVAAREVRAGDPKAVVLAPCIHPNSEEWVARALGAGATTGADVFSYHGYGVFHHGAYEQVRRWAAHGRSGPLPIWNTETGVTSRTFYRHVPDRHVDGYTTWLRPVPYDVAAEQCVKLFVLALAGGAERYFQYWCVYEESLLPRLSAMTVFEYDAALRPMAVAYAVAGSLLHGTRGRGWLELPGPVLANLLEDDERLVAVVWRRGGRRARRITVPLAPSAVDARDLMGNPVDLEPRGAGFELAVGGEPVYLVVPAGRADVLVGALKKAKRVP